MPALRLFLSSTVEEQFQTVGLTWLRTRTGLSARLTAVVTPTRAEGFFWRSRLVAEGSSFLGVRFWTPSDLRQFLLKKKGVGLSVITRNALRLLTRTLAAEYAEASGDVFAQSIAREPAGFLRTHESLIEAGWLPEQDGPAEGRELARRLDQALRELEQQTQADAHRLLRERAERARSEAPLLGEVLLVGFNATHGPLWDLLRAATLWAESSTVALTAPLVFAETPDQIWINAWEAAAGIPAEITEPEEEILRGPFVEVAEAFERGEISTKKNFNLSFLVGANVTTMISAVVAQTLAFLREKSCTRLGLIFPQADAVALGVASELAARGIPLNDGIGYVATNFFSTRRWQSWLLLQTERTAARLLDFVRAWESEGGAELAAWADLHAAGMRARQVAQTLDQAEGETLLDELDRLIPWWEADRSNRRGQALAQFCRYFITWPERASWPEWFANLQEEFARLGWTEAVAEMVAHAPDWPDRLASSELCIPRSAFFAWLQEATKMTARERAAGSNHFYGKVHLLLAPQLGGQTWSHLILVGLNEGVWPRDPESSAFNSRFELEELNRRAHSLNSANLVAGAQGEGQDLISGHGYVLTSLDRQSLGWRDLCVALENTHEKAAVAAAMKMGERLLLPSDLFAHLYQCQTGDVLDDGAFTQLAKETSGWVEKNRPALIGETKSPEEEIAKTQHAYARRRDRTQGFGSYEYAFSAPPPEPIQMSAKDWEFALNHPAAAWWKNVVGARVWPEEQLAWPRAIGTWVHRWLDEAVREVALAPGDLTEAVRKKAEAARWPGQKISPGVWPSWWLEIWQQALSIALDLAQALSPHLLGQEVRAEVRLPMGLRVALPGQNESSLALIGQPDLVLFAPGEEIWTGRSAWIIDYKTGNDTPLSLQKLKNQQGWQIVFYAWALRAMGTGPVQISLLKPGRNLAAQLSLDDVLACPELFVIIERMHQQGLFGQRPAASEEYSFAPDLPLATLPILPSILEQKWKIIAGDITDPSEEEDA